MRIHRFEVQPDIPESLRGLSDIAHNLWYSWTPEVAELFNRLDPDTWAASGRNPATTLATVPQAVLEEAAEDASFVAELQRLLTRMTEQCNGTSSWFSTEAGAEVRDLTVAYFSLEFGLDQSLPIYSGGLGVLAGDHLKSASDLGLPLVAVGLLYGSGYFRQALNVDGWQQELYPPNDWATMPVTRETDENGTPRTVQVTMAGVEVHAQIWKVQVGRVPLYLLDTDVEQNDPEYRDITRTLYGGDKEMRLRQELLLGIGGARALKALGVIPTVFHMNEGHSAFLALERMRSLRADDGLELAAALEQVSASTVFTTHTPVPAGNEVFDTVLLQPYLEPVAAELGMDWASFVAMGLEPGKDETVFGMTPLALRTAAFANGVSALHGEVSREMWHSLWPDLRVSEVPIHSVTNGVHPRTWLAREMAQLIDRYVGPRLQAEPGDHTNWERARNIPLGELWRVKQRRRERLVMVARERLAWQLRRRGASPTVVRQADDMLRPDILTIGFARRFATYKRATLLFRQPERLVKLLTDAERPIQFIFSGKAHPADSPGKELIQEIARFSQGTSAHQRLVFLEDYEMNLSRNLVSGCDVWLNAPRRPMEASGTSGMKAAINGTLNLSIPDGWWVEGYSPEVGWSIGTGEVYADQDEQDAIECDALFNLLEQEIIPMFYRRDVNGLPREWTERMRASIAVLGAEFNTHRMVQDYARTSYFPAHIGSAKLAADDHARARALADWRARVRATWPGVSLRSDVTVPASPHVGDSVKVTVRADLAGLSPDEVTVELLAGHPDPDGVPKGDAITAEHVTSDGDAEIFGTDIVLTDSGQAAIAARIRPTNPDAVNPLNPTHITSE